MIMKRKKRILEEKIEKVAQVSDDIKKDYDYTRGNLYSLIEKGQEATISYLALNDESLENVKEPGKQRRLDLKSYFFFD